MCSPSTPDTTKADANAGQMVQLNRDQFDWVKQQYASEAPDRAAASTTARETSDLQNQFMRQQLGLSSEAADRYRTIYQPLEQKQAQEAADYNTEAKASELAGKAQTDVQTGFASARATTDRNMASMGINPADGAYDASNRDLQRGQALSEANARTKARADAATMGHALIADAIGTGKGVVSNQATTAGIAINAGNSSVANAQVPLQVAQNGVGMVQGAANNASNGLNAAGNIYLKSADMTAQAGQAANSGTGALIGAGMTAAAIF